MAKACPKDPNWRSKPYRDHIKTFDCCVCDKYPLSIPHHVRRGTDGAGSYKPSDYWCVPLCFDCHTEVHKGEETFDAKLPITLKSTACIMAADSKGLVPAKYLRKMSSEERFDV